MTASAATKKKVESLRSQIRHHNYQYHVLDDPDVPDADAKNQGAMNGEDLALNLRGIGMRHGKFGIFRGVSRYHASSRPVQFVFITHNKVTMELARQLTGVTMQEPGVSRLVSVDLDAAVNMVAS